MALNYGGTAEKLSKGQVPGNHVPAAVTEVVDPESSSVREYPILKSVFENADPDVAFTALMTALGVLIEAELTNDLNIAGLTSVDAHADLRLLQNDLTTNESLYTTAEPTFTATVTVFWTTNE